MNNVFVDMPILSVLIWLPILGAVIILAGDSDRNSDGSRSRWVALGVSTVELVLAIALLVAFNPHASGFQFVEIPLVQEKPIRSGKGRG